MTGATGFVGGRLVARLRADGRRVRALARPGSDVRALEGLGVEIARGDVRDPTSLERALAGCDRVVHAAAQTSSRALSPRELAETNVAGSANVAAAAARAGVERLVHVSTCGVYGFRCPSPCDEDAPFAPDTPYRESKVRAERAVEAVARETGLPVVVARLASVYGGGARNWVRMCLDLLDGSFRMVGDGRVGYHPVHVSDVADALARCAETPGIGGRRYNVAGPEALPWGDFVATLARTLGAAQPSGSWPALPFLALRRIDLAVARHLGVRIRRLASYDLFLADRRFDTSRARADLGWTPSVGVDEGLADLVAAYRDEGLLPAAD